MRNLDVLNEKLAQFNLPAHRIQISESMTNIEWLRKHLPQRNEVDSETVRLLNMSAYSLFQKYEGEGGGN